LAAPLAAHEALTLRQAVELALQSNPLVAAAGAGEKEAEARIRQARSGYMPRVQFSESLQRGNNPVFVFSSLLTQHQFGEEDFALGPLNRPNPLTNYQSRLMVEQVAFDGRQTSRGVEAARFTRTMAGEDTRRSQSDVILNVLRTYLGVALAEKTWRSHGSPVRAPRRTSSAPSSSIGPAGALRRTYWRCGSTSQPCTSSRSAPRMSWLWFAPRSTMRSASASIVRSS
jgi:hypothetical protein